MTNNSSTGGYLAPVNTPYVPTSPEGQALLDFIQAQLVGITGISGTLVRPRWQPDPPILPANSIDWIAFAVVNGLGETYATEFHITPDPAIDPNYPYPFDVIERNEKFDVPCSIYGPNADYNARLLREGFSLSQNREVLWLNGMGFSGAGVVTPMPVQVNNIWYNRVDVTFSFQRVIREVYQVLNIASADGTLIVDQPPITRTITVTDN